MLSHFKPYIVLGLASALYYSGVLWLYQRLTGRPFAVILNYHRILVPTEQEHKLLPAMFVSPETFDRHLRYLAQNYRVVTMEQLMEEKWTRNIPSRPLCAITFDDGWSDNYRYALPLLKQHGLVATLFVSTEFIGSNRVPWFYALLQSLQVVSDLLMRGVVGVESLCVHGFPDQITSWAQLPAAERLGAVERTIETLKLLPAVELTEVADRLSELAQQSAGQDGVEEPAMLSWDNVREMRTYGIEIGSHGVTHSILTRVTENQLDYELSESKKTIEQELKETIVGFSYPNGDYSDHMASLLDKAGYSYACTIKPGYVDHESPPYRLNRLLLHNDNTYTTALFACHMAGLFNRGRE